MKRLSLIPACLLLSACGRYEDFTLPKLEPGATGAVRWTWNVYPEPVLRRGAGGAWDRVDALNPSVVNTAIGLVNFYSGYDGRMWHTGVATPANGDGTSWYSHVKVISPDARTWEGDYIAANGSALFADGKYFYWYQAGRLPRIGLARSAMPMKLEKYGYGPVLEPGPRGSWDERGVADPYVIRIGSLFYMYFLGQDRARRQRLGVALSEDGIHWRKYLGNPILELGNPGAFDDTGLGEPAVWQQHGSYWMLYTARDRREYRRLGLARSQDGVTWSRVTEEPVLAGRQAWNAKVVCDPTVVVDGDAVRVWFGGGDRAEPAENLNGQIGYAVLRLRVGE